MNYDLIIRENLRRNHLRRSDTYDPLLGNPRSPWRKEIRREGRSHYLPDSMLRDPAYSEGLSRLEWERLRLRHDFEFWAARCVKISDKLTGADIPFLLNRPQRRLVETLEAQRRAGRPIRLILLKARQWGASTLLQIYCAWIQIVHARNWHSLICAHVKHTSATVRAMLAKLLASYPVDLWDGGERDEAPALKP
ncbi:MAG: terminase, partial [Duncaniella sp.]|nr:terminase [Duncaniella sp.]